jgi:CHAT domain-containing protein
MTSPLRIATMTAAMLVALTLTGVSLAKSPQAASFSSYMPELQRLQRNGDAAGMERVARQAQIELQSKLGPSSPEVANAITWVGIALHAQGRNAEAEPLLRRALAIRQKALGPQHLDVAVSMNNLAQVLLPLRRFAETEPLMRRALAIDEAALGPNNSLIARDLNNLTDLKWQQGLYTEAEPLARRSLAIREATLGPENLETSVSLYNLAELLKAQRRFAEAEPLYRRVLAIREKALGPTNAYALNSLGSLAGNLQDQFRYAEAEPLYRRAVASAETAWGPEHLNTAANLHNLAQLLANEGRHREAEALYRRVLAIREKQLGPEDGVIAGSLNHLAMLLAAEGLTSEAEELLRRSLAICEKTYGPEDPNTAASLDTLGVLLSNQHREAESEPLLRRALAIHEKTLGPDNLETNKNLENFAGALMAQHRDAEAEQMMRRAAANIEKAVGPENPFTAASLANLAFLLQQEGRNAEAEPLLRRALNIREKNEGPDNSDTANSLNALASLYKSENRYQDAEPLLRRALAINEKALGPDQQITITARLNLAYTEAMLGKLADAAGIYRRACSTASAAARSPDQSGDTVRAAKSKAYACWTLLSLDLWDWSAQGGGTEANDRPDALKVEAFSASQRAVQSAAGDAMARSAALTAAKDAAVGPQAQAYEAALLQRDDLDLQFAKAAATPGKAGVEQSQALAKARSEAIAEINRLAAALKTSAPRYWDYRSPEPVSTQVLQSKTGADAVLLHDDEALIEFLIAPDKDRGLVFGINKDRAAWARLSLSGDEIKARVNKLRAEIDPEAYGLQSGVGAGPIPAYFDRQASFELYQALLGDTAIQAVFKDKPVLLFVPSGPLISLPPGLLVTAPPQGGAAGDRDPEALRATAWLLRSKAVAILPAVSSLRSLRQLLPADKAATPDPLLAFADPDFSRPKAAPKKRLASAASRGFSSYFRDGLPLAEALDGLPSLPGTRIEGEALERALGGRPGSLLTGRDASKAQLMARNVDGRLAQVKVLEFATHGLVAGDASDLAEPALALAAGAKPEDELLLASEAATLKLHADWVLLSACNTASPDAPEAQGLSGLSRAFFFAGAKSLLVSHWRVRDDVAPKLIPAMLLAQRQHPDLGRAEALRQASLAILDDHTINATDPSAWAAFALVGEAGR